MSVVRLINNEFLSLSYIKCLLLFPLEKSIKLKTLTNLLKTMVKA